MTAKDDYESNSDLVDTGEEIETMPELDAWLRRYIDPRWPDSVQFGQFWSQTSYFGHFRAHGNPETPIPIRLKTEKPSRRLADYL